MTRWGRIGLIGLAVVVVAAVVYGFLPRPVAVDAAQVVRAPLTVSVEEEGRTRVIDRFVVSAPVTSFLRRIPLDAGAALARGDELAVLEPVPPILLDPRSRAAARAQVAAARSALDAAQAQARAARVEAEFARVQYDRIRRLCEIQCASEEEQDAARTLMLQRQAALRSAEFAVEVARFELAAAETALEYSAAEPVAADEQVSLGAPVDGVVLRLYQESEGVVQSGTPLLELGDPQALEVLVELLSADAVGLRPGAAVELERWGGEGLLQGVVKQVEPSGFTKVSALGVEEQRVNVIVDLITPPERRQGLGDGYRVEARFILWREDDVLQVPSSAVFRHDEGWAVFVIEAQRARLRPVQTGQRNGLQVQILQGLEAGERVIEHPDDTVSDGVRVELRQT